MVCGFGLWCVKHPTVIFFCAVGSEDRVPRREERREFVAAEIARSFGSITAKTLVTCPGQQASNLHCREKNNLICIHLSS